MYTYTELKTQGRVKMRRVSQLLNSAGFDLSVVVVSLTRFCSVVDVILIVKLIKLI